MGVGSCSEVASSNTNKSMQYRFHNKVEGFRSSNGIFSTPLTSFLVGGLRHVVLEVKVGTNIEAYLGVGYTGCNSDEDRRGTKEATQSFNSA